MGNYIARESSDLFDPNTGACVGVLDLFGREQIFAQLGPLLPGDSVLAASINTAAIQAALRNRGVIQITYPGTYYTNDTLLAYSDTSLQLGPGVEIRMRAGTSKVMLTTESQFQTGRTVTLTWTSGTLVDVGWTNHGLVAGDYAWLLGATESTYRGVFRVDSVTDANNFKVYLATAPAAAASGTLTGKKATANLTVSGGKWNSDYPNNAGAFLDSFCMSFYGCANVAVEDVTFAISSKFSLCFCAFFNASAKRINSYNTQSDSVKVYGPGNAFYGENITGFAGDDFVSVQPEEGAAFTQYQIQTGDLHQIQFNGIHGKHSGVNSNFNAYLSDTCQLYSLDVKGVGGNGLAGISVAIQKSAGMTTGFAKKIKISGVSTSCINQVYFASGQVDHFTIEDMQMNPHLLSSSPAVGFTGTATVSLLEILRCNFSYGTWPSTGNQFPITLTGTADLVVIDGCRFIDGGAGACFAVNLNTGMNVKMISISNCYHNTGVFLYVGGAPTQTPQVNLDDNIMEGTNPVFVAGNVNLSFSGNRFLNASSGVVRFNNTFTSTIKSEGTNNLIAGSWITVAAGTPVITLYGWDIAVDPIALTGLATTAEQFCLSTRASAVNQGPAVRKAAGWIALGSGASGVNTVIS